MLILTRHPGESIIIGENDMIEITILSINENQVSIGIQAPKTMEISRTELIRREQEAEKTKN